MITKWHNESGKPLSSFSWLEAHHKAKATEREEFAKSIIRSKKGPISRIVDLGCGPALWLDLFDKILPNDCEIIGIDSDQMALMEAKKIAKSWHREYQFIQADISNKEVEIPEADIFLAFNIFPYLKQPQEMLTLIKSKLFDHGMLAVRQYDGATMRFGPMKHENRLKVDKSLFNSVGESNQFHHYDLDRVYQILEESPFDKKNIEFELFFRKHPYSREFLTYYKNTIDWTSVYISEKAAECLKEWSDLYLGNNLKSSYFSEVDLVAMLS